MPDIGKKYGNKITNAGASSPGRGIEFTESTCGMVPVLTTVSPEKFSTLELQKTQLTQINGPRPALVIAIDVAQPQNLRAEAASAGFFADPEETPSASAPWQDYPGLGPLARITVDDPATVLQEAEAALRCIWPDIP